MLILQEDWDALKQLHWSGRVMRSRGATANLGQVSRLVTPGLEVLMDMGGSFAAVSQQAYGELLRPPCCGYCAAATVLWLPCCGYHAVGTLLRLQVSCGRF